MRRPVLLVLLLALAAVLSPPASAGPLPDDTPTYTLFAPVRAEGVETLLVVFPGGFLPASSQTALVRRVQAASDQRLWVGVAKFTGDLATAAEGEVRLAEITAAVAARGFTSVTPQRTFLAGHSLGGVMATVVGQQHPLAGVALWAAYVPDLPGLAGLATYPRPVLTLGGTLDGRSRLTRTALSQEQALGAGLQFEDRLRTKPVALLDGANHASFGDGAALSNDLSAELPVAEAHARIAELTAAFLNLNTQGVQAEQRARARRALQDADALSQNLTEAFRSGLRDEQGDFCESAQYELASLQRPQGAVFADNRVTTDGRAFAGLPPGTDDSRGHPVFLTTSLTVPEDRTGDQPSVPVSARSFGCRAVDAATVAQALPGEQRTEVQDCEAVNRDTLARTLRHVEPQFRRRFEAAGSRVRFLPDTVVPSATALADARLTYRRGPDGVLEVGSPRYDGPGERSCHLLTRARAAELVMVDALK